GSLTSLNTLGSAATDSQSIGEETPTQSVEKVPATLTGTSIAFSLILSLFDLQGKVEDSNILSHVGKLRKEFKSTLKIRYYKEMVQEGQSVEEIYENNPFGVHDDQWKWLVERWGTLQAAHEACKRVKDFMPTPENSFAAQDNIALENEVYTQVFGLDKDGKCWDMDVG
ncbi:hypothetical protein Goshw_014493, partial [Gossypium schwendimanii]|nr:hypothetical protein [Gossypium schwendimanii]